MAIYTKLMSHQQLMSDFCKDKDYFGIFAEYGVGKSLTALNIIEENKVRKTLVVSTKTAILSTWVDEIKQHTNFKYVTLIGSRKHKINQLYLGMRRSQIDASYYHSEKKHPVIFLINFDGVENVFDELAQANFDLIIIDESTKIKSYKTKRTKVLWKLGEYVERRCIMTGFPITENIADVYAQIRFLDHGECFGTSYPAFMDKYFVKLGVKYAPRKKGAKEILAKIKPFCIRVSGSVIKLPPKIYKPIHVSLTKQQTEILSELNDFFQLEFGKVSIDTQYIFTLINKSLQVCDGFIQSGIPKRDKYGHAMFDEDGKPIYDGKALEIVDTNKDDALLEVLDEIDITKNKVLIWTAYKFSMKKISKLLRAHNPLTLSADTEDVNATVNKFQHGKHNVLIATQKKASASITLTNCRYAIYYSNTWSYDERGNSEARIYRKGSEKHESVIYTDIYVKDSVEEKVIECLKKKSNLIKLLKNQFGGIKVNG